MKSMKEYGAIAPKPTGGKGQQGRAHNTAMAGKAPNSKSKPVKKTLAK